VKTMLVNEFGEVLASQYRPARFATSAIISQTVMSALLMWFQTTKHNHIYSPLKFSSNGIKSGYKSKERVTFSVSMQQERVV
jgi:hypothetical protein